MSYIRSSLTSCLPETTPPNANKMFIRYSEAIGLRLFKFYRCVALPNNYYELGFQNDLCQREPLRAIFAENFFCSFLSITQKILNISKYFLFHCTYIFFTFNFVFWRAWKIRKHFPSQINQRVLKSKLDVGVFPNTPTPLIDTNLVWFLKKIWALVLPAWRLFKIFFFKVQNLNYNGAILIDFCSSIFLPIPMFG